MISTTMGPDADQRRRLGSFLRARREALPPERDDLRQRRTPGLRREEVAGRCGVSTTWYTWLEQGRDISLSAAALGRLAAALELTGPERAYLFDLAAKRDPHAPAPPREDLTLDALVEAVAAPAYALDPCWTAVNWNAAALDLFAGWLGGAERNLLRYIFLDREAPAFIVDWADRAARVVAEFRADMGHRPGDEGMAALVAALQAGSPDFAALWNTHGVLARDGGLRRFQHATRGAVRYTQLTLLPATHPDHKIVVLLPAK